MINKTSSFIQHSETFTKIRVLILSVLQIQSTIVPYVMILFSLKAYVYVCVTLRAGA
ncbi:hypothetical protein Hanom_Chr13g01222271 [Helianthus anomalus]